VGGGSESSLNHLPHSDDHISVNCPNCGSALRVVEGKDHLICDACRSIHFPEPNDDGVRVLGEWSNQFCPVCRTPLVHAAHSRQPLLYCESCRGMLLAMDDFLRLVETLRARHKAPPFPPRPVDPADLKRSARCPKCGDRMDTHIYGGPGNIVIDNCAACRLNWLDYQELARITAGADAQLNEDAWAGL